MFVRRTEARGEVNLAGPELLRRNVRGPREEGVASVVVLSFVAWLVWEYIYQLMKGSPKKLVGKK